MKSAAITRCISYWHPCHCVISPNFSRYLTNDCILICSEETLQVSIHWVLDSIRTAFRVASPETSFSHANDQLAVRVFAIESRLRRWRQWQQRRRRRYSDDNDDNDDNDDLYSSECTFRCTYNIYTLYALNDAIVQSAVSSGARSIRWVILDTTHSHAAQPQWLRGKYREKDYDIFSSISWSPSSHNSIRVLHCISSLPLWANERHAIFRILLFFTSLFQVLWPFAFCWTIRRIVQFFQAEFRCGKDNIGDDIHHHYRHLCTSNLSGKLLFRREC